MSLGSSTPESAHSQEEFDPLAPSPLPDEMLQSYRELEANITGEPVPQVNPFDHYEVLPITQCVTSEYNDGDPEVTSWFSYQAVIGFSSQEDHESFQNHPKRAEIEDVIVGAITTENEETLRLEMIRDNEGNYPDASHMTFNSGTIGDFQVTIDNNIPVINGMYGTNIAGGYVEEQSAELPPLICGNPEFDNVAENSDGTDGQTYTAFKM